MEADTALAVAALSGIGDYAPEELVLTAGPGTPLAAIESALAERGQHLAFEPGGASGGGTLGGALACNDSGPRRIAAGAARDHFLGCAAVSGRGEAFKSGGRVVKNVTGYDLPKLLAGSRGTLAVLTEVTVKVLPKPEDTATVVIFGLADTDAVALLCAAAGGTGEVSGLAHLPPAAAARSAVAAVADADGAATALRVEGPAPSVAARAAALRARHAAGDSVVLGYDESRDLWREVRDAAPLAAAPVLWRLSVPPAAGARVAAALAAERDAEFLYDWAGGRLWVALPSPDVAADSVHAAAEGGGGHATLVRAPESLFRSVPHAPRLAPAVAALHRRLKQGFDPAGVLNPGAMGVV